MTKFSKFAAAVAPAALLLAAGTSPADAKVLLMGDGGWEVSFDGSVNGFAVMTDDSALTDGGVDTTGTAIGHSLGLGAPLQQPNPDDGFRVRTGLLPAVFGMNVKAPTTGGLDMAARMGLYPNISNNGKNTFHNNADLDMREIFFTVDGAWGQVLVGKTLSQFMGKNILTDMTLFGVGGVGAVKQLGGTTLGRIGYGYPYPQFNGRIQYTTPDMSGFKASIGAYDPAQITGCSANGTDPMAVFVGASCAGASETTSPRIEGEVSYAGKFSSVSVSGWVNGLWQDADFRNATAVGAFGPPAPTAGVIAAVAAAGAGSPAAIGNTVTSWGIGGGLQVGIPVGPGTLNLMGSGYTGEALGLTFMLDNVVPVLSDAIDAFGREREHDGFIGQATYSFGQGTSVGVSYGESNADETPFDTFARNSAFAAGTSWAEIESQSLWDGMIWHDINPNLRIVAEYGHQNVDWFDGADQDSDIVSLGAFFFW